MNPRSRASAGVTSRVVLAVAVVLVAALATVAVLELSPVASKSSTATGVSTTTASPSVAASSMTTSSSCPNQSSTTSSSKEAGGYGVATPIGVGVFFNGSIFQGPMMGFAVAPGSSSAIRVAVTYPWAGFSSLPSDTCIPVSYVIGPFPASSNESTIPSWLHVSLSSPSGAITRSSNSTVDLLVRTDSSAPKGAIGSLELQVTYLDPESGVSAADGNVLNLLAAPSASPITRLTQACCSTNVTGVALAAPLSPGGPANLTLTVMNSGYYPAGYLEAFVENGTFPPQNNPPPNSGMVFYNGTVAANASKTFSFSVPSSTIAVVPGAQYTVIIQVNYVGAGGGVFQFSTHRTVVVAVAG